MPKKLTIVVHSEDLDKIYSALIIGSGALSYGLNVTLFFTFWGLRRLIKGNLSKAPLSKYNFLGIGSWAMKRKMRKSKVISLNELIHDFKELGGKIVACSMTMKVHGITKEALDQSLIDDYGSVGTYINESKDANITLFI